MNVKNSKKLNVIDEKIVGSKVKYHIYTVFNIGTKKISYLISGNRSNMFIPKDEYKALVDGLKALKTTKPKSNKKGFKKAVDNDTKFCVSCGEQIPTSAKFCASCGGKQ
jgi:hypothetical protein